MTVNKKPYVIVIAEIIYLAISKIKQDNSEISNIEAIDRFIGTKVYKEISSGNFHDKWFKELKSENFVDKKTGEKIPTETIKLLEVQKSTIVKELNISNLYYAKSSFPLESSQKAFDLLWRMCESYELWCKESKKNKVLPLNIIN